MRWPARLLNELRQYIIRCECHKGSQCVCCWEYRSMMTLLWEDWEMTLDVRGVLLGRTGAVSACGNPVCVRPSHHVGGTVYNVVSPVQRRLDERLKMVLEYGDYPIERRELSG